MSKPEKGRDSPLAEVPSAVEPSQGAKVAKRFNFWTAFGIAVCTSGAVCADRYPSFYFYPDLLLTYPIFVLE